MKSARALVIASLTIGLLLTSVVTVAAQEDTDVDELTATSWVSGTAGDARQTTQGTDSPQGGGFIEHRGYIFGDSAIDTDDPRLNGSMTVVANGDERYLSGTAGSGELTDIQGLGVRITNDEGGWSGQGTALIHGNGSTLTTDLDTIILAGQGAYEGLTAYLIIDNTSTPRTVEGTIFEGQITPLPEPPAE